MSKDSLGDRMKGYEQVYRHKAVRKVPLLIRVDGKAFHTLTKGSNKPFDERFRNAMLQAATLTAKEIQGFKVGYVQSDEVTFLVTDYETTETDCWFGYNVQKITSITAAYMSVFFTHALLQTDFEIKSLPVFDARVFSVPKEDVVNVFLWRAQDWRRNSIQMFARSIFSHKELHKKSQKEVQEMLWNVGSDWAAECTASQKNGIFFYKEGRTMMQNPEIYAEYGAIEALVGQYL